MITRTFVANLPQEQKRFTSYAVNFLAHILLSDNDSDVVIGNFIADSVRRSEWNRFKPAVVKGIKLHHKIDEFTDSHPIVMKSKERLRARHHKYSPVIVDIFYDHFLARYFNNYHEAALEKFVADHYGLFRDRYDELPGSIQHMLPYMIRHNWLVNYGNRDGLERVFGGMHRRASFKNEMHKAVEDLYGDYEEYKNEFELYFPVLREYAREQIQLL